MKDRAVYKFGEFSLDATAKVLFKAGSPLHLTRKAVETLLVLAENSGQVVTKQEIIQAVWTDRVVDDANLAQNIAMIRKVVEAPPGNPGHIETFPGRGYRLEGPVVCSADVAAVPIIPTPKRMDRRIALGALIALAVGAVAWATLRRQPRAPDDNFRVTAVTRLPGKEYQPALSPDGSSIAFLWAPEGSKPPAVWIKVAGEGSPRELTRAPGHYSSPSWSPDGRSIACLRIGRSSNEVLILAVDTGQEKLVGSMAPPNYGFDNRLLDWSPNGEWLVASHSGAPGRPLALVLIAASTGEKRELTQPGRDVFGDTDPRFSPDGTTVSFIRSTERSRQELLVVPSKGGQPTQLTRDAKQVSSHDWSRDGKSVVFASNRTGEFRLWRMRMDVADPAANVSPVGIYGEFPIQVAVARQSSALVYSILHQDRNIWRLDLKDKTWKRILASTGQDASPQYSPSGERICFRSDRSGEEQLWVSNADGTGAAQVTRGKPRPSVGRWSPDGREIAFNDPGTRETFVATEVEAGRWTIRNTGIIGVHPVFAPDGQWIYLGGANGLRRVRPAGGSASSIARSEGISLDVPADGKYVYFVREPNDTALWRASLETGEVSQVLDGLVPGCTSCWALSPEGIYYLGSDKQSFDSQILYFRDFKTSKDRVVLAYPEPLWPQGSGPFSLSRDGRYLLCVRVDPSNSDAMLVSPFQ